MRLKIRGLAPREERDLREVLERLIATLASAYVVDQAVRSWAAGNKVKIEHLMVDLDPIHHMTVDVRFALRPLCPKCRLPNEIPVNDYVCFACREALPS